MLKGSSWNNALGSMKAYYVLSPDLRARALSCNLKKIFSGTGSVPISLGLMVYVATEK